MAKIIAAFSWFAFITSVSPILAEETITTATAGTPVNTVKVYPTEFCLMEIPLGDKVTSQSTTQSSDVVGASKAVDGDTDGDYDYGRGTCTATSYGEKYPWWAVDLGSSVRIRKVVIYNRVDCCNNKLLGATVRIGDSTSYLSNPECESRVSDEQIKMSQFIVINCNLTGRYLSIYQPREDEDTLTLCEVKAYMAQTCANASDTTAAISTTITTSTGRGSTSNISTRRGSTTTITSGVIPSTDAIDPVECYRESDGSDYRGRVSTTQDGLTCQKWTSQYPHTHDRSPDRFPDAGLGDHNFCRNPDSSKVPWCYTTEISLRWDKCDVGEPRDVCPNISAISPSTTLANQSVGFKDNSKALWHLVSLSLLAIPTIFCLLFG